MISLGGWQLQQLPGCISPLLLALCRDTTQLDTFSSSFRQLSSHGYDLVIRGGSHKPKLLSQGSQTWKARSRWLRFLKERESEV